MGDEQPKPASDGENAAAAEEDAALVEGLAEADAELTHDRARQAQEKGRALEYEMEAEYLRGRSVAEPKQGDDGSARETDEA
jgi:hypothetical protein